MLRLIRNFLALALVCSVFISCKKNGSENSGGSSGGSGGANPVGGTTLPLIPVNTSLTGLIVDENNNPLSGVAVKAGNNATGTNTTGNFVFNNIILDKYTSLVTATLSGYYKGYRIFSASSKGANFVKIQLIKRPFASLIDGNTGGTVTSGGASIVFGTASFSDAATGAAYTGSVRVYAKIIDPSQNNIGSLLPGGLIGLDSNNKNVCLQSFGMMAVEIEGTAGQKLQIANGKAASITYPIVSSYTSSAPSSIPLWYVDETTGIWKQEGRAIKTGTNYTGTVSHFSFWNWDVSFAKYVVLEMTLKNNTGEPLANTFVRINLVASSGTRFLSVGGYTDATGYVGGLVPANVDLSMDIISDCNSILNSRSLGQFTQNTDLGNLSANIGSNQLLLAGTVKNCSNALLPYAQLSVFFENRVMSLTADATGAFRFSFTKCSGTGYTIIAKDVAGGQVSIAYTYPVNTPGNTSLDLKACAYPVVPFVVSTLAGAGFGNNGYIDATGTAARFWEPQSVAADANGNVYVADTYNHCIRKITPAGVVTTFAGSATPGFADGSVATAMFKGPRGVCIADDGTIYVADNGNFRIRKISNGIVSTLAGTGVPGYVDGPGNVATLNFIGNLALDGNSNIYFPQENTVRKITPTGVVSTIAGGFSGYLDGPVSTAQFTSLGQIAIDSLNNIYVTENVSSRVRKITPGGMVSTLAGLPYGNSPGVYEGGFGSYAILGEITAITVGKGGFIYYFQHGAAKVRKITPEGYVTTIAGNDNMGYVNGPGLSASFQSSWGICSDKFGNIYVADGLNQCIRKLTPQ